MKRLIFLILACAISVPASAQPSIFATLQRLRAEYPAHMEPAQLAELLNRTAYEHREEGWKLLKKGSGNSCPLRPGNLFISCDILIGGPGNPPHHFDVLVASDEVAVPAWQDVGPCELGPKSGCSMANAVNPIRPINSPEPQPGPQPGPVTPPAPVDLTPLLSRITALEQAVADLRAQDADIRALLAASDSDLRKIIAALPAGGTIACGQLPKYRGSGWFGVVISTAQCK